MKRVAWQGTDYIERRLLLVNNRLSFVIVPSWAGSLEPERANEYLRSAEETRDWLASQRPPTARSRRWAEHELMRLDLHIKKAKQKLHPKVRGSR